MRWRFLRNRCFSQVAAPEESDPGLSARVSEEKTANLIQQVTSPGTYGTGNHRDAIQTGERAAIMFCEVMYSRACQRVTMLILLPTFAFPASAPRCGS
jgi:hypothetical protein